MDRNRKPRASQSSGQSSEVANACRSAPNAGDENRTPREIIEELKGQHDVDHKFPARVEEKLALNNLESSQPVPYGSYSRSSAAAPDQLHEIAVQVFNDLGNFVLFSVRSGASIETSKARVSEIFFSKFEQMNFGVKGEPLSASPALLPEQSFTEYRAFSADFDDAEDEAMKPYMPKYERFLHFKLAKIQKICGQVVSINEGSYGHFCRLARNVWMLHKLSFSFERANVRLMRVVPGEPFIDKFMESVGQQDADQLERKSPATTLTVKHVMMPGFWINKSVIKCRVCLGPAPATPLREGDAVHETTGPRRMDETQDEAHPPTSSQAPDREALPARAPAHQQTTQAMQHAITDEPHACGESHSLHPAEELGNDKISAEEVDQCALGITNMDINRALTTALVSDSERELEPSHSPYPSIAPHGNRPSPYHGSA